MKSDYDKRLFDKRISLTKLEELAQEILKTEDESLCFSGIDVLCKRGGCDVLILDVIDHLPETYRGAYLRYAEALDEGEECHLDTMLKIHPDDADIVGDPKDCSYLQGDQRW
jgi:hypothetical protein